MKPSDLKVGMVLSDKSGCDFEVIFINGWDSVGCRYLKTGTEFVTQKSNVIRGSSRDRMHKDQLGAFIGIGAYKENFIFSGVRVYSVWRNMINRCLNKESKAYKTYGKAGVKICSEWMNYQVFAEWFEKNYPTDGAKYQIDKDVAGKMLYSPDTCVFLTPKENTIASRAKKYEITYIDGTTEQVLSLSDYAKRTGRQQSTLARLALSNAGGKRSNKDIKNIMEIQ